MAEINIKTINQLQEFLLNQQGTKLDNNDYIVVSDSEDGTTYKISLQTLKDLTLAGQETIGADSTFKVEDTNLEIGKKSIIVPKEEIEEYLEQLGKEGVLLKVNQESNATKITAIDGVSLEGETITVPALQISDEQNHSFNTKNYDNSLQFKGPVTVNTKTKEDNSKQIEVSFNDNDTVLQAFTQEGLENIGKIKAGSNITFSTTQDITDNSTILTVGLGEDSTIAKAFSLKVYEAQEVIKEDNIHNKNYSCLDIKDFDEDQVVAIHFNKPILHSPTFLNDFPIVYYNQHGEKQDNLIQEDSTDFISLTTERDTIIVNSIIQDYAILKKSVYNGSYEYRIIFADAIQTLYQDWQIDSSDNDSPVGFPATVRVTSKLAGISFTALTPAIFTTDSNNQYYINPDYIKKLNNSNIDSESFRVNYEQLINSDGSILIPDNRLPESIKNVPITIVEGQNIVYDNEAIIFTNSESMTIHTGGGGEGGSTPAQETVKLTKISCLNDLNNDNNYNIDNVSSLSEGFYLIQFKYGLKNNVTGLHFTFTSIPLSNPMYIYYDGDSTEHKEIKKNFIDAQDSLLFYYKDSLFYFISNDNAVGDRIQITSSNEDNVIVLEQNGKSYTINKADYSSKELQTGESQLLELTPGTISNIIDFKLPDRYSADDEINNNYLGNIFLNGLGDWSIPTDGNNQHQNKEEYFLNGEGEWSQPVFNDYQNILDDSSFINKLIDQIYPLGTVYYTTNQYFRPFATGEPNLPEETIQKNWVGNQSQYRWEGDSFQQEGKTIYRWEKVANNITQAG